MAGIKTERPFADAFMNKEVQDDSQRNFTRTSIVQRMLDSQRVENIGDKTNIKYDAAKRRIIINDGVNDRILIGYDEDGF